MADEEESGACFSEDVRVEFVAENVCFFLKLGRETWEKSAASDDFPKLLKGFFEKETVLFFSLSKQRCLVTSMEVRLSQTIETIR